MARNQLWVLGAAAAANVLLGMGTDMIAAAIGGLSAFAIAGALSLAIGVTFGLKVVAEDLLPRRALLPLSMVGALGLFTIGVVNAPEQTGPTVQAAPSAPAPSPVPVQLTLSQYLDKWRNGPVKLTVEHYNAWVFRATGDDDTDAAVIDLRVGVRNESTAGIDLASAPSSMVLITNEAFDADTYLVDQKRIPEIPAEWHLYAVGFDNDDQFVEADGKKHPIAWSGGTVDVGDDFSSPSPAQNGADYVLPAPATKTSSEIDAIPPTSVHVLGLAWIGSDGMVQGYTPVEQWIGPNKLGSFLQT